MSNVIEFPKRPEDHLKDYEIKLYDAIRTGDIQKIGTVAREYGQAIELFESTSMGGVK